MALHELLSRRMSKTLLAATFFFPPARLSSVFLAIHGFPDLSPMNQKTRSSIALPPPPPDSKLLLPSLPLGPISGQSHVGPLVASRDTNFSLHPRLEIKGLIPRDVPQ